MNCPTVIPAACARAAHVSPWCASMYLVHAAETPENNKAEEARRALSAVDDTMVRMRFQVNEKVTVDPSSALSGPIARRKRYPGNQDAVT